MEAKIIKRIIGRKNFGKYNIPDSFGEKAEVTIAPYAGEENEENPAAESLYLMKAQEISGSVNMLNEPEEEAWNDV